MVHQGLTIALKIKIKKKKKIYFENKNTMEDGSQVNFFETSFVRKMLSFKQRK